MKEEFNPLIEICCTLTVPAAETKSIGLPADALVPSFCSPPRLFHRDTKLLCHLSGLGTVSQLHRDPKLTAVYRDWQKTRHRDADGNSIKPPGR
jgi:hypothetical protein